ncbi:MAG: S53 family peptidase [Ktedonobacteraceae bacterium]|nr:S53 family peptidase [Ktedonobacteraceae bacterium]
MVEKQFSRRKARAFRSLVFFMLLSGILSTCFSSASLAEAMQHTPLVTFSGTLSPLLTRSHLQGQANSEQRISLSLGLHPRHEQSFDQYTQQIIQPGSGSFQHFLSQAHFLQTFSPDEATYNRILAFLKTAGFTVTHTYNHRLLIAFSGTIKQVEQTFHVTINIYTAPDGHIYYANTNEPRLPAWLAGSVLSINGLNNAARWYHTPMHLSTPQQNRQTITTRNGCPVAAQDYLLPKQIAAAYNLDGLYRAHYQGENQTIALFELSTFKMSDLTTYARCFSQGHTRIQRIATGSQPAPANESSLEAELDAEIVLGAVPALATLKIYEAANNASDYLAEWAQIVQDNVPIVSISWGACEASLDANTIRQENMLLQSAVAQGQNIFAASGDTGSAACAALDDSSRYPSLNVNDPAAQPYVTGVGGTSLTLNRNGSYGQETVLNSSLAASPGTPEAVSGGGISQYWQMPDWQNAPGVPGVRNRYTSGEPCHAPAGSYCREVPDVALHADPARGYPIYCTAAYAGCSDSQPWQVVGGTSTATPMWAAIVALSGQMLEHERHARLGFVAPLLYRIARDHAQYATSFHDITRGDNDYKHLNQGKYPAIAGYDMATGLGSCNAYALATQLAQIAGR